MSSTRSSPASLAWQLLADEVVEYVLRRRERNGGARRPEAVRHGICRGRNGHVKLLYLDVRFDVAEEACADAFTAGARTR